MQHLQFFKEMGAVFGGTVVALGVVGWLIRSLVSQLLAKDIEQFKSKLTAISAIESERARHEFQLTTERAKHEMQLSAQEKNIILAELHKRRAAVIAELYGLLTEFRWAAESFTSPMEWSGEPDKREKYALAMNKSAEFFRLYDKNQIYLPHDLCVALEEFLRGMRSKVIGFGVYVSRNENTMTDEALRRKHDAWSDASKYFDEIVPKARNALTREFRILIGTEPNQRVPNHTDEARPPLS